MAAPLPQEHYHRLAKAVFTHLEEIELLADVPEMQSEERREELIRGLASVMESADDPEFWD